MDRDRLLFVKEGRARFISHLDLMRTFQRAFLRAEVPIKHTEGFNPHPFVSIALPLSVGFSSDCEILEVVLLGEPDREGIPGRLNAALPEGIRVQSCYHGGMPIKDLAYLDYAVDVTCSGDRQALMTDWTALLSRESWVVEKKSKKAKSGVVSLDLKPLVRDYQLRDTGEGVLLETRLVAQNPGLNPQVLVTALTEGAPNHILQGVSYRRMEVLDKNGNVFR